MGFSVAFLDEEKEDGELDTILEGWSGGCIVGPLEGMLSWIDLYKVVKTMLKLVSYVRILLGL